MDSYAGSIPQPKPSRAALPVLGAALAFVALILVGVVQARADDVVCGDSSYTEAQDTASIVKLAADVQVKDITGVEVQGLIGAIAQEYNAPAPKELVDAAKAVVFSSVSFNQAIVIFYDAKGCGILQVPGFLIEDINSLLTEAQKKVSVIYPTADLDQGGPKV
jgi:hypothetical protein